MSAIIKPIWNYFDKNEAKAKCKSCSKEMSLGSALPSKQTTANIKRHLEKIHPQEFKKYCKELSEQTKEKPTCVKPIANQPTLPKLLDNARKEMWADDSTVSKNIDKSIMDFIIVDMLPYNVVEGPAFKRLNFDDPQKFNKYRKKSENFFRTSLMPDTHERVKARVVEELKKAEWISFTTDVWTNPSKSCSLLSFTAHFIDGPKRMKYVLGASVLKDDHTGIHISEKLEEIIEAFKLENKIHIGVSDNAKNMKCAMRHGEFLSFGCMAHTIQLVIRDSLDKLKTYKELITKCRSIVGHFKKSEPAYRKLKEFQKQCSLPKHQLTQDIETRWNSTYFMMRRLLEQKDALCLYAIKFTKIKMLSAKEWKTMSEIVNLLECFYEATLDISGDQASISIVIPLFQMLKFKLVDVKSESELKASLKQNLAKRFLFVEENTFLMVATLLDPRFKSKYLSSDQIEKCTIEIHSFLKDSSIILETTTTTENPSNNNTKRNRRKSIKGQSLWEKHDAEPHIEVQELNENVIDKEIKIFLAEPLSSRNINIFEYWNSSPFINLKAVAIKYLSAPPTSVASEQLFSAAGQLYSDRRSNLHGINAEKLLFIHYNIKIFNFEY